MKKIKILMLHLGFGGIEKQTITMANSLVEDYEIEIVSFYKLSQKPAYEIDNKIKIKYLYNGGPNREEFLQSLKRFNIFKIFFEGIKALKIICLKKKLIKKEIINDDADIYFSTREEFAKLLSKYGIKNKVKITQEHNFIDTNSYRDRIVREYRNLDYVVVISKHHEKMYNDWFKNSNVTIFRIENILDNFPKQRSNLNNNAVVAAGRFNYIKDFPSLIDAINIAVLDNPNLKLYLLGDGEEKDKIVKLVEEYNLQNNVVMPGFVDSSKVREYMLKSDIYLMTSISECFPMVLLEAEACGLPIISFDILSGPREIIENGKNGFLIPDRNASLMAKKINELLNNQDEIKIISENALTDSYKYDAKAIRKKWLNLFK